MAPVLGILAALVGIADTLPYIRDMLRGTTCPHRGTWLIWGVLASIVCFSQHADGATWSLAMSFMEAVSTLTVFVLSLRYGTGGLSRGELLTFGLAGLGVAGWVVADEPIVATACVVAADAVASAMMIPKTWRDPDSETLATYTLGGLGGALAVGAVGTLEPALLLYPAYYGLVCAALATLIIHRRRALRAPSRVEAIPSLA